MARTLVGIAFAFTIMICVGRNPVAGEDMKMSELTISKNGLFPNNNVEVCFNMGELVNELTGYTYFQLDVLENLEHGLFYKGISLEIPEQLITDPICTKSQDKGCLNTKEIGLMKGKPVSWVLHVEETENPGNTEPGLEHHATITMPELLPVDSPPEGIYIIGETNAKTIKIPSDIGTEKLFLNGVEFETTPCTEYPCYYNQTMTEPITAVSFKYCASAEIRVCGDPTVGTQIKNKDEVSTLSVSVEYTATGTKATFTSTGHFTEVINLDTLKGCDSLTNCPMTDSFEALLIDITDSQEKFKRYSVSDRKLVAYELSPGSGILEVKWAKLSDDYYFMSRTSSPSDADDTSPKKANVDCSFVVGDFCHAYFVELLTASHAIQIQKILTWSGEYTPEVDNWKVTKETTKSTFDKLQLTNINKEFQAIPIESVVTTVSESIIELDVCFKYITNTTKVDTHYEFLAVNSKGKWKKEIGDKKIYESQACFQGLELQLVDFSESSKFFVLLRDSSNGKPIASGEVTLDLTAVRAIKPEVNNGNNGSTSTLAIVGAAIAGIACLMALVAATIMFVMKINRNNDGLQYPLQHNNIEDSSTIHGLDNSIPTM